MAHFTNVEGKGDMLMRTWGERCDRVSRLDVGALNVQAIYPDFPSHEQLADVQLGLQLLQL